MACRRTTGLGLLAILLTACQPARPPPRDAFDDRTGRWTDESGAPVTLADLRGTPLVLTAFYTSCSVRCPLTVEALRAIDDAYRRADRPVAIRLLTLDPRTDTPERLVRFKQTRHLPDRWHFLRGSPEDTRALARTLAIRPAYDDGHIDHEVRITVFDGAGTAVRSFAGWDFDPRAAVWP